MTAATIKSRDLEIVGDLREQTVRRILNAVRGSVSLDGERAIENIVNSLPLLDAGTSADGPTDPEIASPFMALGQGFDNTCASYEVVAQNQYVEARLARRAGSNTYQLLVDALPEHVTSEFGETFPFRHGLLAEISVDRLETIERMANALREVVRQARQFTFVAQDGSRRNADG